MGFKDVLVLGRYRYNYAHQALEEHTHGELFEICYLDEGTQEYRVEDDDYLLKGGDVFVTFPHERHGSGYAPLCRGRLYWMIIAVPGKGERFLNLPPKQSQELVQRLLSVPCRQFKGTSRMKLCLESIFNAHDGDVEFKSAELKNWMMRFLLDVIERADHHAKTLVSPRIAKVLKYIDDHICDEYISIEQLADVCHLSESWFKTRFKNETGVAPGSYIMTRKIEKSKELLEKDDASITDVAYAVGFSSSQYFSTVFKRCTNQMPSEWKRHPGTT